MIRESMYTAAYLGGIPILRKHLDAVPAVRDTPGGPLVGSGLVAGILAAITTQPVDTIKTRMQAFPDTTTHPHYRNIATTARHIVSGEGAGTLFAGIVPRGGRIVCAVFILTGTRNTLVEKVEGWKEG
jgi:hypothetical protein